MRLAAPDYFPPVLFSLLVGTFFVVMAAIGGCEVSTRVVFFSYAFSGLLLYVGILLLKSCKWARKETVLPAAFIAGFVIFSVIMMILALTAGIRAKTSSVLIGALILFWGYLKKPEKSPAYHYEYSSIAVALLIAMIIGVFAFMPVASPVILQKTSVLPIWSDYFIHGETIAAFGSPIAIRANMELAGESPVFYHYAPFMLPAAFQAFSGMSGLATATSFLLPLGLLICAFGIYVFAFELSGKLGGMLAIATIALIPAYSLFVQSGWFSFHWLLFIAPGTGYALGIAFMICALLMRYLDNRESSAFWLMIVLLLALIVVRVHIFILLAPAIVVMLAYAFWPKRTLALSSAFLAFVVIAMLVAQHVPALNALWMNFSHPYDYLKQALDGSHIRGLAIAETEQPFVQLLLAVTAVLGAYTFITPLFFWCVARRTAFSTIHTLPYLILIVFVLLIMCAPAARNGDLSEYKHRHFPLLYATFAIYSACYAVSLAERHLGKQAGRNMVVIFVSGILILSLACYRGVNPASPDITTMAWGSQFHDQRVPLGLYQAAGYLRAHAQKGDVMTMPNESINGMVNNEIIEVISLSGVPAFLARPSMKISDSECIRTLVNKRLKTVSIVYAAATWPEARELMRSSGIRWLMVPRKTEAGWSQNIENAVFRSGNFALYDAGADVRDVYVNPEC